MANWGWILPGVVAVAALGAWVGRAWLKRLVERTVDHEFDTKLEQVRSELRMSESRVAALQATVLSNRSGRRALVDKRRIEALENIWRASLKLGPFQMALTSFSVLNLDALDERAPNDPKLAKAITMMIGGEKVDAASVLEGTKSQEERPFLPADVWSTYIAYQAVLSFAFTRLHIISTGIDNPKGLIKEDSVLKLAKAALPKLADYIEQNGITAISYLAEPLREQLVAQIQQALDGHEVDQADIARASEVVKLVGEMQNAEVQAKLQAE